MGKRDYLKDYVPTEDGGYEYVGTHWSWPSAEVRASFIARARTLFLVAVFCLVGAGCIPAPGTFGAFYVVIPFIVAAIGYVLSGISLYRISTEPDPMRDHIYAANVPSLAVKLMVGALGSLLCGAAAAIHGIVLLATGSAEASPVLTLLFAVFMIFGGVCLWRLQTLVSSTIFTREKS